MTSDTIKTETSGAVTTITLNRPEKLNSFTTEMSRALLAALTAAADDAVRAVVLTGAGKGFSAGQDLSDRLMRPGEAPDLGVTIEANWNPAVRAVRALRKPVIAAVNGVAAGASANLAFACDIVLAARSARFIQPFCRLGLVPDCGGTHTLTHLVGPARAKGLAMLGAPLSAEDAEPVAVDHGFGDRHGERGRAGPDGADLHAERLRSGVVPPHGLGAALRQFKRAMRGRTHFSVPVNTAARFSMKARTPSA